MLDFLGCGAKVTLHGSFGVFVDRKTSDRILTEEGIDDSRARDEVWERRPHDDMDEDRLRCATRTIVSNGLFAEWKKKMSIH